MNARPSRPPRSPLPRLALLALLLASSGAALRAQVVLHALSGEAPGQHYGRVFPAGDLTGDGILDLAVGTPLDDAGGTDAGALRLVSGADGSTVWRVDGSLPGERLGSSAAPVGDVDGDGVGDLLVGAPGAAGSAQTGSARLLSGADGGLLRQLAGGEAGGRYGAAVSGAGDLDDDGVPDLLVGAPGEGGGAGAVHALSGADGSSLWTGTGQAGDGYGHSVDGLPSDPLKNDNDPGIVIGATQGGGQGRGYVELRSRDDLALLRVHAGLEAWDRFGCDVRLAGDVDGDGVLDLVVGSDPRSNEGPTGPGYVRVLSGADGALLHTWTADGPDTGFGLAVQALGDVNADGFDDVAVGEPRFAAGAGRVRLFSGKDGALLHELLGAPGTDGRLGSQVVGLGDLDGDQLPDFSTSAPGDDGAGSDAGLVLVVSFTPWRIEGDGVAGAAGEPHLAGAGSLEPGTSITLSLRNAAPLAGATLVAGHALVYNAALGILEPTADAQGPAQLTDGAGQLVVEETWPAGWPADSLVYYQYRIADPSAPGALARSNTLSGRTP